MRLDRDEARFAAGVAAGLLAFFVLVGIIYPAKPAILALGLITGSLSGLIAMGLVLVYRANRIVNFAQGDIGGAASILAASLIVGRSWAFLPAVAVGLVAALGLGALVEILVIRRFAKAPRLQLTVATIGLAQLFQVVELVLPKVFGYDTVPQPPEPFKFSYEWAPVTFRGGHVLILVIVPLVAAGLGLFLRRTRVGIGVRASAESADRASLLGIPVRRLNTIVWVMASGLSGLAVLLRMPIQGVAIGSPLGPSLLLLALAAAVIGRMENLPRTLGAALVLGMVDQSVYFATGNNIISGAVLLAVILVALLTQGNLDLDRARDIGASSWNAIREVRPIPRELMRLREVRAGLGVLAGVAGLVLIFVPLGLGKSQVNLLGIGLIFGITMCSLVVLTGWAGQISLGQLAIMAFGSAVAWSLALQGKNFFVCLAVAALTGAGIAIVLGVPALRIKGPFLAVTTLAFALTTGTYLLNPDYFPWLIPRVQDRLPARPIIFDKFDLESDYAYYYVILFALGLVILSVRRLRSSRTGRVLIANRDNSRAAQSYGVSPVRAQLVAFGLSGCFAGLAGGLYLFHQRQLSGTLLDPANDILVFAIGVVGGLGSVLGGLIAAAYLYFVNYSPFTTQESSRLFASGIGLMVIMMLRPDGLGGAMYAARDAILRRVATWRGVIVPSLLADIRVDDEDAALLGRVDGSAVTMRQRAVAAAPPDDALLVVRDLEVAYDKAKVLFGVDFHVRRGEIVALLGTNGAGKSTLLSAVCGLVKPLAGTVSFDGVDITGAAPTETVGRGIVLMPGGKGVFPTLTVEENLRLAGWLYQDDPEHIEQATARVLEFFPILRERWLQRAGNLSGGEQQMLTLGQALIARPELLLIDELSLGLAPIVVEGLLAIVRAIHEGGTTVVLVEQSVNVAITLAQRAVFLEKGEVRFDGKTADLLERPELLRAVFLETHASRSAARGAPGVDTNGHRPFVAHCDVCGHEHSVALELRDVGASFGGIRAVDGVDLSVRQGQILGMIGPNGAGKTTVLDIISGFVTPSSGRVLLGSTDVTELAAHGRALLGLGRSFQDARLFPSMTVRDTIATALERHVPVPDPLAAFLLSPAVKISEREIAREVDELIELMRLGAYADKFIGELSTGTRRIVDLACVLAHKPSVLLLDEPSSGIAQRETEALAPVLLDIRDRTGAALVVIEHDMPLITAISDELVALELGSVVARGEPEAVVRDPAVIEGYLGTSAAAINRSGARIAGSSTQRGDGAPGTDAAAGNGRRRREKPLVAAGRR